MSKVGVAVKAGVASLAALGAFAIYGAIGSGPTLASDEEASEELYISNSSDRTRQLSSVAPAAVGDAMLARLAAYKNLPTAKVSVLVDSEAGATTSARPGSFARLNYWRGGCPVIVVVDADFKSSVSQSMVEDLGFKPSARLSLMIQDFEVLHELGHCAMQQSSSEFEHPSLSSAQNKAIAAALPNTMEKEVWQEAFADAYATATMLGRANLNASEREQLKLDLDLLLQWRKMTRMRAQTASEDGETIKVVLRPDPHLTEIAFKEALISERWLDNSIPIEKRAAQLASIGLIRTLAVSGNPFPSGIKRLDPDRQAMQSQSLPLSKLGDRMLPMISWAIDQGYNRQQFVLYFNQRFNEYLISSGLGSLSRGQEGEKLGEDLGVIAWSVYKKEKVDSSLIEANGDEGSEALARGLGKRLASDPAWSDRINQLARIRLAGNQDENEASQAWRHAMSQEARYEHALDDPRREAMAKALAAERSGSGVALKGFYPPELADDSGASKLDQWRKAKSPSPSASQDALKQTPF